MPIYNRDGERIIGCYEMKIPKKWEKELAAYIGTTNRFEIKSYIFNQLIVMLHEMPVEYPKEIKRILSICFDVCKAADFDFRMRMEDE